MHTHMALNGDNQVKEIVGGLVEVVIGHILLHDQSYPINTSSL